MTELGQDQIEDLQRRHFERALLEEVAERIGRAIARDLQDAFVDREQHDARRPLGADSASFSASPGFTSDGASTVTGLRRASTSIENGCTPYDSGLV